MFDYILYPRHRGVSGIYEIFCHTNSKRYIGSADDLVKRRTNHLSELRNNHHANIHLQRAWNKYGETAFEFRVIEFCSPDILLEREQFYIDTVRPEFNIATRAGASFKGRKHTEESKKRNSVLAKKRMEVGGFFRKHISSILSGRKQPDDIVAKRAASNTGKVRSEQTKQKTSNSLKGKSHSLNRIENITTAIRNAIATANSEGRTIGRQKFTPLQVVEIRKLNQEGMNYVDLAEKFQTVPSTIRAICLRLSYKHIN